MGGADVQEEPSGQAEFQPHPPGEGEWIQGGEGSQGWWLTVTLSRTSAAEKWGFAWHRDYLKQHNVRILDTIDATSPLGRWNASQLQRDAGAWQDHTVEPGDRLVQVNG